MMMSSQKLDRYMGGRSEEFHNGGDRRSFPGHDISGLGGSCRAGATAE
jgi:hypothetical protein